MLLFSVDRREGMEHVLRHAWCPSHVSQETQTKRRERQITLLQISLQVKWWQSIFIIRFVRTRTCSQTSSGRAIFKSFFTWAWITIAINGSWGKCQFWRKQEESGDQQQHCTSLSGCTGIYTFLEMERCMFAYASKSWKSIPLLCG